MEYHGFRSIREYERECRKHGLNTERIPFQRGGEQFFVLITSPPKTATSVEAWALFTADETEQLLDGVINGVNANYLGKLAAHGYFPENDQGIAQQTGDQLSLF